MSPSPESFFVLVEHPDRFEEIDIVAKSSVTVDHFRHSILESLKENLVILDEATARKHAGRTGLFQVVMGQGAFTPIFVEPESQGPESDPAATQRLKAIDIEHPNHEELASGLKQNLVRHLGHLRDLVDTESDEEYFLERLDGVLAAYAQGLETIHSLQKTLSATDAEHYKKAVKEVGTSSEAFRLYSEAAHRLGHSSPPYGIHHYILAILKAKNNV